MSLMSLYKRIAASGNEIAWSTGFGLGLIQAAVYLRSERVRIQLFRERLSEKVHGTIAKGIVRGFEFTVLQRNLKERHERHER